MYTFSIGNSGTLGAISSEVGWNRFPVDAIGLRTTSRSKHLYFPVNAIGLGTTSWSTRLDYEPLPGRCGWTRNHFRSKHLYFPVDTIGLGTTSRSTRLD